MSLTKNYKSVKFGPKSEKCYNFYEICLLEQIENANYQ